MKVYFNNLKYLHEEIKSEILENFIDVYEKGWFIRGDKCTEFENAFAEYCGCKHCVGVGTGLDAITIILKALSIGIGDEVIIPSNTFIATALAVTQAGAKPILVEPTIESFNIDTTKIEEKITSKTKAIIPVHLYGQIADMDEINQIAKKHNLFVIEDACQAHGATYKGKKAGSLSDAAAFSFYPGKNLGALGDGGAIVTNNDVIEKRTREFSNYGSEIRYHHNVKGTNSRLDEIQSSILLTKLKNLDLSNEFRNKVALKYISNIKNPLIKLPVCQTNRQHVWHIFAVLSPYRDELKSYLHENGIETIIHYPIPINMQMAYFDEKFENQPIAEMVSKQQLSLPMYYGMTDFEQDYVINIINKFKSEIK